LATLGVKDAVIAELCQQVPEQTLDMRVAMMAHASAPTNSALDALRALLPQDVKAATVAVRPDACAARWLLQRLGVLGPQPNVIVARVVTPAERPQVLDFIRRTEADFQVSNLPVLVLASSTSSFFAEGSLGSRRVEQLVTPVRMERILRALGSLQGSQALQQAA
jgi:hypothetical protein